MHWVVWFRIKVKSLFLKHFCVDITTLSRVRRLHVYFCFLCQNNVLYLFFFLHLYIFSSYDASFIICRQIIGEVHSYAEFVSFLQTNDQSINCSTFGFSRSHVLLKTKSSKLHCYLTSCSRYFSHL